MEAAETKATKGTINSTNDSALTEPIEPRNPTITLEPSGAVDSKEMEEPRPGIFDLLSIYRD